MSKSTVTVTCSWFSSAPVFADVLAAVKREMDKKKILVPWGIKALEELLPLNGGEPFKGFTEWGPHTYIRFEASTLAKAVQAAELLEIVLRHEFPGTANGSCGDTFLGMGFGFAGKSLEKLLESLETVLGNAQQELKQTRRFLPNKRIQDVRLALEGLHDEIHS